MMYYYGDYYPYHMLGFGSLFMLLCIGGMIYMLFAHRHHDRSKGQGDRAMDILKERYAKGEITKAEFEAMKKDLQ